MRVFWVSFPGVIGNLFRLLFFLLSRWLLVLVDILVVLVAAVVSIAAEEASTVRAPTAAPFQVLQLGTAAASVRGSS